MNKTKFIPLLLCLAFFSSAGLLYLRWPFYEQALMAAVISVPIILVLPRKWLPIFLFAILLASIGIALQDPPAYLTSMGIYFLLSIFQFSLWATAEQLKQLTEETNRLKTQQHELLQKDRELRPLDLQEFVEQALWMLKTNSHKERTWLMEVIPSVKCPIQTAELERAALKSIVRDRDLVTSRQGSIYLLIKEKEGDSIQTLLRRLEKAMSIKNQTPRYEIKKTPITNVCEMGSLLS